MAIGVITPPATLLAAVASTPSPGESAKESTTHEYRCDDLGLLAASISRVQLSIPPSARIVCYRLERISCTPVVLVESFLCHLRDVLDHEIIARVNEMDYLVEVT
jgi:hypothetical protein